MPLFGQPHKRSLHALKRVVDVSAMISPPKPTTHLMEDVDGSNEHGAAHSRDLFLSQAMRKHFERLYDALRGPRCREVSREKVVDFLRATQGEKVVDHQLPARDSFKFEEFMELWWKCYCWDAMRPADINNKDLSKPMTNYFISSSHNTYLSGNQIASKSSAEAYVQVRPRQSRTLLDRARLTRMTMQVLSRGCRCVEIDVWNGDLSGSRTPADPDRPLSAKPEHRRHLSSGSLPSVAASVFEAVEDKYERVRERLRRPSHSRNPSASNSQFSTTPGPGQPPGPRDTSHSLDPNALAERLSRPRSRATYNRSEPIVMHGWTFTAPVGFRDVCKAIRDSAFKNNPLPIIVSLEVRCDMDQQELMVEIMKEEWKGYLIEEPMLGCDPKIRPPRLEELLNKILVKVKKAPTNTTIPMSLATLSPTGTIDDDASGSEDERPPSPSPAAGSSAVPANRARKVPICESLSKLAVYTHSEHFRSFETPAARTPTHIFSISEKRILELHETKHQEMFVHNRDFFMRAFPHGMRVDSSNLDPSLFWRKGVQMVAMNWQSWDEGMMLNEGMFAGEQGWVLKPQGYRSADRATCQAEAATRRMLDLTITVYAGQHIPLAEGQTKERAFRPYVKCELHVERAEERATEQIPGGGFAREQGDFKVKTTRRETDHPDWGENGVDLEFKCIPNVVEELSFVR